MNETKEVQESSASSNTLAAAGVKENQVSLVDKADENTPKELNDQILHQIMDLGYLAARVLYTAAEKVGEKQRGIIAPFYKFLRSFHERKSQILCKVLTIASKWYIINNTK